MKQVEKGMVSVIMPAYNASNYIEEALLSAVHQTYRDIEIIVVDDGSVDTTKEIVQGFAVSHANVRYIYQENKGSSTARNNGLKNARGEFVAFLDADDIFLPKKIESQVRFLEEHPDCDISYCAIWHFDNNSHRIYYRDYHFYSGDAFFPHFLYTMFVNPLSVVMRRNVVGRFGYFNETYRYSEDWEYFLRLAYRGAHFRFLNERLGKYRVDASSKSYRGDREVERKRTTLKIFLDLQSAMTVEDRDRFHMKRVIRAHKMRYYAALLAKRVSFIGKYYSWIQKRRNLR